MFWWRLKLKRKGFSHFIRYWKENRCSNWSRSLWLSTKQRVSPRQTKMKTDYIWTIDFSNWGYHRSDRKDIQMKKNLCPRVGFGCSLSLIVSLENSLYIFNYLWLEFWFGKCFVAESIVWKERKLRSTCGGVLLLNSKDISLLYDFCICQWTRHYWQLALHIGKQAR